MGIQIAPEFFDQQMAVKNKEIKGLKAEVERLEDKEQEWIDYGCYYRNLAIRCGAVPPDMRNKFDADLCQQGILDNPETPTDQEEINGLWKEVERLKEESKTETAVLLQAQAEVERLELDITILRNANINVRRELDEAREAAGWLLLNGEFDKGCGADARDNWPWLEE